MPSKSEPKWKHSRHLDAIIQMAEEYEGHVLTEDEKYEDENIGTLTMRGILLGIQLAQEHPDVAIAIRREQEASLPMPNVVRAINAAHTQAIVNKDTKPWIDLIHSESAEEEDARIH